MAESRRRAQGSKLDKLAAYRRAREGGTREWKQEETGDIYDEVDEDEYRSIVKGRLQRDDFIEDDGVGGYADNGMDDFGAGDEQEDSEEEVKSKSKKKAAKDKKSKPKLPPPVAPTINDYRPKPSAANEQDFMASLMGNMDTIVPDTKSHSRKRKPVHRSPSPPSSPDPRARSFGSYRNDRNYGFPSSDPVSDDALGPLSDDLPASSPMKKPRRDENSSLRNGLNVKSEPFSDGFDIPLDSSFDDMDMGMDLDFMDVEEVKPTEVKPEAIPEVKPIVLPPKAAPQPPVKKQDDETPSWLGVHEGLAVVSDDVLGSGPGSSAAAVHASKINALEEDGSLRFFWLDYLELDGNVHFIGKLKDKTSGQWTSCCITVTNLQRNVFVLPREKQIDEDGEETDIVPDQMDVYKDFDIARKQLGVKLFKGKFVKRKYAFGESGVPTAETTWLKVVYPFTEPAFPQGISSPNFSHIFGSNTSAFELLVLKRKIMGPCWLEIKKPHIEHKAISWCKFEATVEDPKDINPFPETDEAAPKEMPPLTVMSLSVRSIVNHTANKREIVCATSRTWSNIQIDDPTPPDQLPCSVHTFVRPLDRFPNNFEKVARANKKGITSPEPNERTLLNRLLLTIYKSDPDIIIGHEFLGVSLDVLLTRMRDLKADNWSRIGRFRRSRWPNIGRQGTNLRFLNGRLLCDLTSDGAKTMISSTTWSLTEMCASHLKSERQDIDPEETANYFDGAVSSPAKLMTFVRHCELDAHYHMAIAAKVQILPLTKQLTNLAGNSWNKTLNGGRAERNEYILLHEFHRLKYICPDKSYGRKSAAVVKLEAEEGDTAVVTSTKGKRDKYKGGLVFEPKRGLWDKYILVMDFNSLYPSIIQEYNIDFTTIDRSSIDEADDKIPEPPQSDVPQGVLPRLIATLVNRRKQVKSLMKDRSVTPAKRQQYDIKQQALKLTANSMYGCLGFEYSRFYARPLAALTTFKGREILTQTRELAESLQLDVVYGDTDSVFVNTNVTDFAEALKISHEFKKHVNERYRLLEIDLDGVFQRLLLLQKKKYAALKMEDGTKTSVEIKGLDMKRREYCTLSKQTSQYVLDQILSGEATEIVVEKIHEYLDTLGENVRAGKVNMDEFIVYKRLGKNPEDYPDVKSQPHVQVALRMKTRGGNAKSGDVIPYIFCLSEDGQSSKSGHADKAQHPEEIRKSDGKLKIDFEYYLAQQVLPPIERLCEPIEGTDRGRLAECLGLDAGRYRSHVPSESQEQGLSTLESQIPDKIRFKDTDPLLIKCRGCKAEMPFTPISQRQSSILHASGPVCPGCNEPLNAASMQVQLESQIRAHISKLYEWWTVCDDPMCRNRTRMMGVYGRQCLKQECRGNVSVEYSDVQLYTQLLYYASLFDEKKAMQGVTEPAKKQEITALVQQNTIFLDTMNQTVEKYLSQCGRRWVEMSTLFSFMRV